MANTNNTYYQGRYNTTLARKEWRRYGHDTLVVDGGVVTTPVDPVVITPLVVGLVSSPSTVTSGVIVTLTASVTSGGTAPYTYLFTAPTGYTLAGSGASRTFTASSSAASPTFRVRITDSSSPAKVQETTTVVTIGTSVVGTSLFPGHIPNHVILSLAGPSGSSGRPTFDEGVTLLKAASLATIGSQGAGSYGRRRFDPSGTNGSATDTQSLRDMLNEGDADGVYNVVSFKVTGTDWKGVAAGNYPNIPAMFRTVALERRAAGKPKYLCSLHHEPLGDETQGPSGQVLGDWASMHVYMSNQLKDLNDIMGWCTIGNGNSWNGTTAAQLADRESQYPQTLIDTLRVNKGVAMVDCYDGGTPTYSGQQTTVTTPNNAKSSVKTGVWISWMRARNCGALGLGEWSCINPTGVPAMAQILFANRDVMAFANYFNSIANSKWDWRMVPATYAAGLNSQAAGDAPDLGGTALTEGRMNEYTKVMRDSMLPANNGPLT